MSVKYSNETIGNRTRDLPARKVAKYVIFLYDTFVDYTLRWGRDGVFGTVTRLRAGWSWVRIRIGARNLCVL
jgi:hypothetical protein